MKTTVDTRHAWSMVKEVTNIMEVGTQEGQTENPSSVFKEVTDIVEVGTQEGQTENPSSVFKEVTDIVEVGTQVPAVEAALIVEAAPVTQPVALAVELGTPAQPMKVECRRK